MISHSSFITVRYAETDQMKFAHHASYIVWFEYARIEMMKHIGISYAQLERQGYLMPVLEVNVRYNHYASFDEKLEIVTTLVEMPRARMRFKYEILNKLGKRICDGHSLHAFINAQNKAIRPPKALMQKIAKYF